MTFEAALLFSGAGRFFFARAISWYSVSRRNPQKTHRNQQILLSAALVLSLSKHLRDFSVFLREKFFLAASRNISTFKKLHS